MNRLRPALPTVAFLLACAALCLPMLVNGAPLFFWDTHDYLSAGGSIAHYLWTGEEGWYGMRSPVYSLLTVVGRGLGGIRGIVVIHAALLVFCLASLLRLFGPRRWWELPALGLALALSSSAGMFSSLLLADIFAGIGVVALAALALDDGPERILGRGRRIGLAACLALAVAAHPSHLPLFLALGLGLVALRRRWRALVWLLLPPLLGAVAFFGLQRALLGPGHPGTRPPYLLARVVADGPGRDYLDACRDCAGRWAVCTRWELWDRVDSDSFLWAPGGPFADASPALRRRMLREELPLVFEAVRRQPWRQLRRSVWNALCQLVRLNYEDLLFQRDEPRLYRALRHDAELVRGSLQTREELPLAGLSLFHDGVLALAALALLVLLLRDRRASRARRLALLACAALLVNGAITGTVATVASRFQMRVAWLLPLAVVLWLRALWKARDQQPSPAEEE